MGGLAEQRGRVPRRRPRSRLAPPDGGDGGDDQALDERRGRQHRPGSRAVGSSSRSRASSALRTALPRSIRTTTPAGPSTFSIASLTCTASVPNVVSSSPAATSIRTGRPCSISPASAERGPRQRPAVRDDDDADARSRSHGGLLRSGEARRRRAARRAAARRWSRPGPGGRRCARRGSWRGPCGPASGWSRRVRRRRPRRGLGQRLGQVGARRRQPCSSASTAGASASYIVLSPACALPRATTPSSPARSAAATCSGDGRRRRRRATCPSAGRACRTAARSRRRPWRPASSRPC